MRKEASVSKKEIVVKGLISYALSKVKKKYGTGKDFKTCVH